MASEDPGKSTTLCGLPFKWVLFLVLVAAYMENCDSDTVRQFQYISRARNAAQMAKKNGAKEATAGVPKFKVVRVAQVPVPVIMSGGYSKVTSGPQKQRGFMEGNVQVVAGRNEMLESPAPTFGGTSDSTGSGGYGDSFSTHLNHVPLMDHQASSGGYSAPSGYEKPTLYLSEVQQMGHHEGWGMPEHEGHHHHKPQHHGWGWKPEKKKKKSKFEKKNPNDIIYSILGIAILKLGTTVVLGALSILILVLATINVTRLTIISPLSLPLHAFWIGALFVIPFVPLFWIALVIVGTTDILTHLKIKHDPEEEEEHHHGHGWSHSTGVISMHQAPGHEAGRRSSAALPQWLLRKRILQTLKALPDFDHFEAKYS